MKPVRHGAHTQPPKCAPASARRRRLLGQALGVLMLPLLCTSLASSQLRKVRFKIDAGTAPIALAEFVRQTGLQVLFETDAIRNHTTQAVVGQFEAAEALSLMLQGSGLVFEFVNDRTITVRPQPPAQTLPAAARPAAFFRSL